MSSSTLVPSQPNAVREWWIRTALVLTAPRAVFTALRDDSPESTGARSEPVLLVVWLAGMACAVATPSAGHLLSSGFGTYSTSYSADGVDVAIWIFFSGGLLGAVYYLILSGILQRAVRMLGSQGSYRRTRHVLAFAAVPLALSFALLPLKLAFFGEDIFRAGGSDAGRGGEIFLGVQLAFGVWSLVLLVIGVRAVHGWTWPRAAGAVGLAAALPAAVAILALTA